MFGVQNSMSDEPRKTFPVRGECYYHLEGEIDLLQDELKEEDNKSTSDIINTIRNKPVISWGDLYALESCIITLLPVAKLQRRAWSMRDKYRVVVGDQVYAAYLRSNPPDPNDSG